MTGAQVSTLLMQEQGKAEAQRVAKLRELGIAADPRPAMDLAQAQQVVDALSRGGATGLLAGSLEHLMPVGTSATERRTAQMRRGCLELGALSGGLLYAAGLVGFFVTAAVNPMAWALAVSAYLHGGALGAALYFSDCEDR